jgi:Stress responsive A/B Barrel Domain
MNSDVSFLHMVYFWLNTADSREDAAALLAGIEANLRGIETVKWLEAGTPAGTDRDVVDNSYGVGLAVGFASSSDHDIYQDHPMHLKFIAECSHLWSQVQVYDTLIR